MLHIMLGRNGTAMKFLGQVLAAGLVLTGSAWGGNGAEETVSDSSRMTQSGFLSDYGRLRPSIAGEGVECWRSADVDLKMYDKVLITRMRVSLKPGQMQDVDPSDLKMLTDYFHDSMVAALKPQMQITNQPGAGVIALRLALTDLVPTKVGRSVASVLIPYGFVVGAITGAVEDRPVGSAPYLGEPVMEMQFLDGASGKILAECRDTQIGSKFAAGLNDGVVDAAKNWASGTVDSFDSWAYAKDAFDKWSALTAKRFSELRGASPK